MNQRERVGDNGVSKRFTAHERRACCDDETKSMIGDSRPFRSGTLPLTPAHSVHMKLQTRYGSIPASLFVENRARLKTLLHANSLAVVNANDVLPTNADGSLRLVANSDLFYLTGIEQEGTILLLYPDAHDEKQRELLFNRDASPELEIWEGHKLTKDEARAISGIERVHALSEFPRLFHRLMCECEYVYLDSNEHKRAVIEVETRQSRF